MELFFLIAAFILAISTALASFFESRETARKENSTDLSAYTAKMKRIKTTLWLALLGAFLIGAAGGYTIYDDNQTSIQNHIKDSTLQSLTDSNRIKSDTILSLQMKTNGLLDSNNHISRDNTALLRDNYKQVQNNLSLTNLLNAQAQGEAKISSQRFDATISNFNNQLNKQDTALNSLQRLLYPIKDVLFTARMKVDLSKPNLLFISSEIKNSYDRLSSYQKDSLRKGIKVNGTEVTEWDGENPLILILDSTSSLINSPDISELYNIFFQFDVYQKNTYIKSVPYPYYNYTNDKILTIFPDLTFRYRYSQPLTINFKNKEIVVDINQAKFEKPAYQDNGVIFSTLDINGAYLFFQTKPIHDGTVMKKFVTPWEFDKLEISFSGLIKKISDYHINKISDNFLGMTILWQKLDNNTTPGVQRPRPPSDDEE